MPLQYLMPKARNLITGQTVKSQALDGEARIELRQRALAQEQAQRLADQMTQRTGQPWTALVETYTPSSRR